MEDRRCGPRRREASAPARAPAPDLEFSPLADADGRPRPARWYAVPHHSRFLTGQSRFTAVRYPPVLPYPSVSPPPAPAWLPGSKLYCGQGIFDYEVCTLESVSPTGIVLNSATGRTATGIYRVDGAHAAVELY